MIVTKQQIEERLHSGKNIIHKGFSSAGKLRSDQPEFIKNIEVGLVIDGESRRDISHAFDVSHSAINRATTSKNLSPEIKEKLETKKIQVRDQALNNLMAALGFINDEKLKAAKLTEVSSVAKDMSVVVEKMSSKDSTGDRALIVFAPVMKTERDYDVVEIHPTTSQGE